MITKLDKTLITLSEAARKFGVSPPTMRHWVNSDRIDAVDVGGGRLMILKDAKDKGLRRPWHNARKERILLNY